MIRFLRKVDNIIFKLQSADKNTSGKLEITIVLKAFPQEYDSIIAAIHFQQISYLQLKERLVGRSLGGSSTKQDTSFTSTPAPATHRTGRKRYKGGAGQRNKKILYCTKCGRNNPTAERCYAQQHVNKQNRATIKAVFLGLHYLQLQMGRSILLYTVDARSTSFQTNQGSRRFLC